MSDRPALDSRTLLRDAIAKLNGAGIPDAYLDAELLLAEAAGLSRVQILTLGHKPDEQAVARFEEMVGQRAARMPLAYILGRREFYSIELKINSSVLIPRPETETLVTAALDFVAAREQLRILDIGTGSGAIAIALALRALSAQIVATDISPAALAVARSNADSFGADGRIDFILADCWSPIGSAAALGRFDVIVSNPPYIADAELDVLEPEVRLYEPRVALTAGPDGLAFYRRIAKGLAGHLALGGGVLLELGFGQAQAVAGILRAAGMESVTLINDLAGIPRVALASAVPSRMRSDEP
jgi:release factor glutamine methyltransferase